MNKYEFLSTLKNRGGISYVSNRPLSYTKAQEAA